MPPFHGRSSSTYDKPKEKDMGCSLGSGMSCSTYEKPKVVEKVKVAEKPLPNPNPERFEIRSSIQKGRFLLLLVNYPDCTNYEGNKILLYENVDIYDLMEQGSIDPHFSNNKEKFSPIARFLPTDYGWQMAEKLIQILQHP